MTPPPAPALLLSVISILLLLLAPSTGALKTDTFTHGIPFNFTDYNSFSVEPPAMISNGALQVTPDSTGNFSLFNSSGRVLYNTPYTIWEKNGSSSSSGARNRIASFNATFLLNIYHTRPNVTGEGMAFIIAPDLATPPGSDGQYLGLTNSTSDGSAGNRLFAVEFDTYKQDFDPDDNHIGVDINSVKSAKVVSLSDFNITLSPNGTVFHKIWIQYDGRNRTLAVYIAELTDKFATVQIPNSPVLTMDDLDLSAVVAEESYFGFSASTGSSTQELHCVLSWNMTVEIIRPPGGSRTAIIVGVVVAIVVILAAVAAIGWIWWRRRKTAADSNVLGVALKSLPGTPREYDFKELKKATENFSEKNRLGEGGYGVVFKGFFPNEIVQEVAVKKFTREDAIKSKDDFLCELTIINRLRHRNLVKLLGWCHKNGTLLLVYEYMPNRSLDGHIFCAEGEPPISWTFRYKILKGVASALHYLHHEYEETVIHRDLKSNNVMLDANFNARLGDFGLARAIDLEKTSYAEMEGNGIHGTMGYIAPECFHTGKATRESDVYAFGAVLLEVATAHRPMTKLGGYSCLVDWVWSLHREGQLLRGVDSRLGKDYVGEEAERVLLLALACSHPIAAQRPKTQAIVQILSGSVAVPIVPPFKPSFVWPSMGPVGDTSLELSMTADSTPVASSQFETEWTPRSYNLESYDNTPRSLN